MLFAVVRILTIISGLVSKRELNKMKCISVIVPVYNVENYLHECVDSILRQTYSNIEVILVDDGSKDKSGSICDEYLEKDSRIKVIHKENAGLGYARNSGLDIASGEYVTFVDSDDYIEENMIKKLYQGIVNNNVDECKMGFQRVTDTGVVYGEKKYEEEVFEGENARLKFFPRMLGSAPKKHDSIEMCVCGALFNNTLIQKNNIRFPSERVLISEDLIFQMEFLQYAKGACTLSARMYKYRINLNSLTKSYNATRLEKACFFYDEVLKRLLQYGYGKDEILRATKMFFINLKVCISQECSFSEHSNREALSGIRKICRDEDVQRIIKSYPVNELDFSQMIFIKCIEHQFCRLLHILKKMRLF